MTDFNVVEKLVVVTIIVLSLVMLVGSILLIANRLLGSCV